MRPSANSDHRTLAYQPALDGVRALAVAAVLAFHGGLAWLPGGFLGVDAFFVLSGFLITSLLLAERARHGRIGLAAFWARRARRLLPALVLVLLVVVVAFRDILSSFDVALLRGDALAALGYVANWRMIYRGDDYFTQTSSPSPLQHTWSLGIEEQFYVLWPLVVAVLLACLLTKARAVLLALCLCGAAASAISAAWLYQPLEASRAYFGTDTRAQALLIGAALAAMLPPAPAGTATFREVPVAVRRGAALASVLGIAAVAWLWTQADGGDSWLYRGGLTLGGVAVAAVLADVTLNPAGFTGRLLAWLPLVWLGRISYGVYLWHWPLFALLNGDRTGLDGLNLLALRVAATVVIAAASYLLIEEPIRTGRWPALPRRTRHEPATRTPTPPAGSPPIGSPPTEGPPPGGPRVRTPIATGIGATAAIGVTAAFILVATLPPTAKAPPAPLALPVASPEPSSATLPPILRSGRKPGAEPRITFFGDSVSWTLGTYLPTYEKISVTVRSVQGCGIARLPEIIQRGGGFTNYPPCPTWDVRWRRGVTRDDPDVAVILLDRWELMDRKLGTVYRHVGDPLFDAYLAAELDLAISIAGSRGARVALLTAPYTRRAERPDGGLYDEDLPQRVDAWNRLLRQAAHRHRDQVTIIDLNTRVCPDGEFTWSIDGLRIRSDGLHFTPEGVQQWIAPWLMPQLATMAVTADADAPVRGD